MTAYGYALAKFKKRMSASQPVNYHTSTVPFLQPWSKTQVDAEAELAALALADGVHTYSNGMIIKANLNVQFASASSHWDWNYGLHRGVRVDLGRVIVYRSTGGAVPLTTVTLQGPTSYISATSTTTPALWVQSPVGRTGTVQEWKDGAGTLLASIDTSGELVLGGTSIELGASGPTITTGTGTPEAVVTAPVGSLFTRTDGGAGTTLYVKESGTGNTGWVAK